MIYCVEDDASIRDIEIYTLKTTGFEARGFETGEELFAGVAIEKPELILLDVMLPGEDGISILERIRKNPETADIPVIIASAKGTEYDKVRGLDIGADDYLAKPFGMMEMVSRVKAILRRTHGTKAEVIRKNAIQINSERHEVIVDGEKVELTLKEYNLLYLMLSHPGIVFTREQLLDRIWGTSYDGETRTVDVHIRTLRQKLKDEGSHINTVRGVGYRYEGD